MVRLFAMIAAVALLAVPSVSAEDSHSEGLCKGDRLDAFYVTKVAGAEGDGIDVGEDLCYRCRYGSRPMVMVFTRNAGEGVAKFVKELDSAVAAHEDAQLKGLVTVIGAESDALKQHAKSIAEMAGAKNVPVVAAKDTQNGPEAYKLNADTDVTVVIASDSSVVARHEFKANGIDVAAVMGEVKKMLN
ncbi:MAG: hypothetical protein AAGD07_07345 [Planctomycetota bacterium]